MNKTIAIKNVSVVPMDANHVFKNQTVIIKDDIIATIDDAASVSIPVDTTVIDGTGKYLMPGLFDMHVHLTHPDDLDLYLAHGVTSVRNMWGNSIHLKWKENIKNGSMVGPRITTASPIMDGSPPAWHGSLGIPEDADVEQIVLDQIKAGYDFLKIYSLLSLNLYDKILKYAKKHGISVSGHVPFRVGLSHALNNPPRCNEHLMCSLEEVQKDDSPVRGKFDRLSRVQKIFHYDDAKIPQLVDRIITSGMWNCPTLIVCESLFMPVAEARKIKKTDAYRAAHPLMLASWQPEKDFRLKALNDVQRAKYCKHMTFYKKVTKALFDAGAPLLIGSDAPNSLVLPGMSLHQELKLFVDQGVPVFDTLQIATLKAAQFFGDQDKLGTVSVGKKADLLLLDKNPLEAIENVQALHTLIVNGKVFSHSELQKKIECNITLYQQPLDNKWFVRDQPKIEHATTFNIIFNDEIVGQETIWKESNHEDDKRITIKSALRMMGLTSVKLDSLFKCDQNGHIDEICVTSLSDLHHLELCICELKTCKKVCSDTASTCEMIPFREMTVNVMPTPLLLGYIPLMINSYVWTEYLKNLEIGQGAVRKFQELEAYPDVCFTEAHVVMKRNENVVYKGIECSSFMIISTTRNAVTHVTLLLDHNYDPVHLAIDDRLGDIEFVPTHLHTQE